MSTLENLPILFVLFACLFVYFCVGLCLSVCLCVCRNSCPTLLHLIPDMYYCFSV